ncbi:MAG TPA: FecR domain-containing protein, partial [Leptolyngbyaceae cyanobacterium M65_K2018_010]|nr:FecR domain-containing protein [Leptolyngbyaceae cyanobacterium M65_K2018_010]
MASTLASCSVLAVSALPARAGVPLTRADIEAILNRVELIQRGRAARAARLTDFLAIGDTLRTAAQSRAELRFNDGSLARLGERATFRFIPNTRNFRLSNGTMLLLVPPGRGRSTVQTPSAITGIQGSALVVRHIEERDLTVVMALTNNPAGPMTVTPTCGDANTGVTGCMTEYPLYAGQMALVQHQQVQILEFDLSTFYQTSALTEGLNLDNSDPNVSLGSDLDSVRAETLEALAQESAFADAVVLNPMVVRVTIPGQDGVNEAGFLTLMSGDDVLVTEAGNSPPPLELLIGVPTGLGLSDGGIASPTGAPSAEIPGFSQPISPGPSSPGVESPPILANPLTDPPGGGSDLSPIPDIPISPSDDVPLATPISPAGETAGNPATPATPATPASPAPGVLRV